MLCHAEQALLTTTALGWWSCWRIPNCETKPLTNRQASATSSRNGSWRSCPPSPGPSRAQHQNLGIKRCSWRNQLYPLVIKRGNGKSLTCGKTYKTSEHVQLIYQNVGGLQPSASRNTRFLSHPWTLSISVSLWHLWHPTLHGDVALGPCLHRPAKQGVRECLLWTGQGWLWYHWGWSAGPMDSHGGNGNHNRLLLNHHGLKGVFKHPTVSLTV